MTKHKCCGSIQSDTYRRVPCSRTGSIERDGKFYCATHDPVAVQARRDKSRAKWEADYAAKQANWARQKIEEQFKAAAIEAIRRIADGHNDPRGLASEIIERFDSASKNTVAAG